MDTEITLADGGRETLGSLEALWNGLNAHHMRLPSHFKDYYSTRSFSDRLAELVSKEGAMRVVRAFRGGIFIGFCVSSVSQDGTGEIDSLAVAAQSRNGGLGSRLIGDALAWFESMDTKRVILSVYEGNTDAARFYERHGFAPKYTVYEKITQEN